MFTGVIEAVGEVLILQKDQNNLNLTIRSELAGELKSGQSVSHNGVCLTVTEVNNSEHIITAVDETLNRSNLKFLSKGDTLNLERSLKVGDRLDGHIVQGHVDATAECIDIVKTDGSWLFTFTCKHEKKQPLIEKGSVCLNGVSLTIVNVDESQFAVAIIPYTFKHTTFKDIKKGHLVNVEFDVIGKYVASLVGA